MNLMEINTILTSFSGWKSSLIALAVILGTIAVGSLAHRLLFRLLDRFAARSDTPLNLSLVKHWSGPGKLLIPLLLLNVVLPSLEVTPSLLAIVQHLLTLALIAAVGWVLVASIFACRALVLRRYDVSVKDNLKARAMLTQVNVLVKIALAVICFIVAAAMLMTFERVRQMGLSLLASAGIVGVVIGFSAQKSLATLFASFQIALTQPIRIDDVVIVEGEWGRIEEITLTYVVVRIWDLRRLVVPVTYFLEKPFQNWTRTSAEILGTVFLYTDYSVPIDEVRQELARILRASPLWDGKVGELVVTNTSERAMELRALMSAVDSGTAWDLRCEVREKLIEFVRREHPHSLPRVRAEMTSWTEPEISESSSPNPPENL